MLLNELSAVSPIDGRYRKSTQSLSQYFSEAGLIQYRVRVEVEYLIALSHVALRGSDFGMLMDKSVELRNWAKSLTIEEIQSVKEIEKTTNHDVKAVEYFVKAKLENLGLNYYKEWVHFGLTSQDINNTSIPWSMKSAVEKEILPKLESVVETLKNQAKSWENQPMLAKTHGQPASPTSLGKEWYVFVSRLESQIETLKNIPYTAKFGGATGNFNAHQIAYPENNWIEFANNFVNQQLGLTRMQFTTQIEPYDFMAAHLDNWKRINNILIDFSRDVWTYISMEYFKQKIKEGEVGSSAMPHKVNPIDFENAEGNLGIANAIMEHLAGKLPISRLQRDLTDSTVLRNLGVPFGHIMIALNSLERGLGKLILNQDAINQDLENNWAVVAEAIQTILRRERYPNPYEALKELTRSNEKMTREKMHLFIDSLEVSQEIKHELKQISPQSYIGVTAEFC